MPDLSYEATVIEKEGLRVFDRPEAHHGADDHSIGCVMKLIKTFTIRTGNDHIANVGCFVCTHASVLAVLLPSINVAQKEVV
jgi:hypothetical protein